MAAVVAGAAAALALLLQGSGGELVGVGFAGLASVLLVVHVLLEERRRHQLAESELSGQASFLDSLVKAFGELTATRGVDELLELSRSEAERLFRARALILEDAGPGEEPSPDTELVVPLRVRDRALGALRLVRSEPFDRDDRVRAAVFGDFASRAIENATLLAEATVRETERARLSEQLVAAEQEERRRLALFLHDTSVQSLAGIALMLDAALHAVADGRPEDARSVLESALQRHRATIRELRDLSFSLEPVILRDQGLAPAVEALTEQLALEQELRIDADVADGEELPEKVQATLYQIIREALDAAVRRGPPNRIAVRVTRPPGGTVALTIVDDAPVERRRSVYEGLEERARAISGGLEVEQGEGGTTLRVELPPATARG